MAIHYRYVVTIGTFQGPQRFGRLACGWVRPDSDAMKYSVIIPSGVTCKRCLGTWTVKHHVARILGIDPALLTDKCSAK